jgi:hypothetical protein
MEVVDKNLLELDGEMVDKECVEELAEKIMEVKRAQKETPQLFEAAARRLIDDGRIIEDDKDLKLLAGEKLKLEQEIKQMRDGMKPKSLKEKMKEAAEELKKKAPKGEDEDE